jgi:hypothetical protein
MLANVGDGEKEGDGGNVANVADEVEGNRGL